MAIGITTIFQGQNAYIADLLAAADGDTTVDVPHGLGRTPLVSIITPTIGAAAAFAALPQWNVSAPTATKVTVNKVGSAGTAVNSNARLIVLAPHSIIE
jgi:hypothetical protein